ncbi:MAG TPA: heavy metal translocating P-type ATPase [Gammaproteobacteria bacterium]|nr:heavy metal translocating P-type ATPase [Gammaproteobacteria bacterium]
MPSQATPTATDHTDKGTCFHCGLPVPSSLDLTVTIDGLEQPMCCHGCQAVARAIVESGNTDFYRHRTEISPTGRETVPDFIRQTEVYDHPAVQKTFVRREEGDIREAALILEGIVCAACVWLNERHVSRLPGVLDMQVNYATHRARLRWDDSRIHLSDILQAIHAIGYVAHPYNPDLQQKNFERERKDRLRRIGVAGVLGMQVMMLSLALYAGAWGGMEAGFRTLFRWVGLVLTTPILLYSGLPFLRGAWRDLQNRSAGMDVPVAIGILVAFGGSMHATLTGRGDVYYDSVAMFVFFLLLSRYFELMARKRGAESAEQLGQSMPTLASRRVAGSDDCETVPVAELAPGDEVMIRPGDNVPADGRVKSGTSSVSESLLTGESTPIRKAPGDTLVGGSINIESPLYMHVERTGMDTVLAEIGRLLEQAQGEKPAITLLADRVASWFVSAVIVIAAITGLYWWQQAPGDWLPILVSVLVVTCPCALSLATPTALSAATGNLLGRGLLTTSSRGLETLARCTHVVFDKTGTLTRGQPVVTDITTYTGLDRQAVVNIAAALELPSEHPAAKAIRACANDNPLTATNIHNFPGAGIRGVVDGRDWFLGNPAFISEHCPQAGLPGSAPSGKNTADTRILLADTTRVAAQFLLTDELRPGAADMVRRLQANGKTTLLMSGDNAAACRRIAALTGITEVYSDMKPDDKLAHLKQLQQQGAVVAMVGDGINDAPVLAAADVSIAMHGAAQISRATSDMVLLSSDLGTLASSVQLAGKTHNIIRQNLAWAAGYNLLALPAAVLGYVAPWMAAIGMSASSLLVVLNALRLVRTEK